MHVEMIWAVELRACVAKSSRIPSLLMPCSWQSCKVRTGQQRIMDKLISLADCRHNDLSVKKCRGEAVEKFANVLN